MGGITEPLGLALGLPLLVPQESTDPAPSRSRLHGPDAAAVLNPAGSEPRPTQRVGPRATTLAARCGGVAMA